MKKRLILLSALIAAVLSAFAAQPKYVFYFIGDGMGMGPAIAAEMYNRQVLNNPLPIPMFQFPVAGFAMTYSASSPVTDSAAAGTALATGVKTKNGMLGMNPDTIPVTSIARLLKDDGYGIGIVTNVAADDATPGAFYAHVANRSMSYDIDVQAAECGYEFLAGAGIKGEADKDGNLNDIPAIMEQNGVQVLRGRDAMAEASSERIFLLNTLGTDRGNIGYAIDSIPDNLTLPFITESCLQHLEKYSPDRFFMMVEGGNIDHALHANDGGAAIKEIINFNEAIQIAVDFYNKHPFETLIVITADHDTGGMSVGSPFTGYNAFLQYIDYQKVSKEAFDAYCHSILSSGKDCSWNEMKEYLSDNLGFWSRLKLTQKQEDAIKDKFEATFKNRDSEDQKTLYANFNAFTAEVYRVFNDIAGIGFVTTRHTGNPVPVFAMGVDANEFMNVNNNIDIPKKIMQIISKKH